MCWQIDLSIPSKEKTMYNIIILTYSPKLVLSDKQKLGIIDADKFCKSQKQQQM